MKKITKAIFFLIVVISLISGCTKPAAKEKTVEQAQIANPASVYCEKQGGRLDMREISEGTAGYCLLPDGAECEEWAYFRGECNKEESAETVSCTTREECVAALGVGAFCSSNGKCIPPPKDNYTYAIRMVDCICPDGTKVKVEENKAKRTCRQADCPGTLTEFAVSGGLMPKAIVNISFPLNAREAKAVAIAACRMSEKVNPPNSSYENIMDGCPTAWGFLDETNPCNNTQILVCDEKAFASCSFGGQTTGTFCINGLHIVQGEYDEKFIAANPLDLSQAKEFTKFRSCAGHDYSGINDKGEPETQRSMKQGALASSGIAKMDIYAPFDGTVIKYAMSTHDQETEEHEIEIIGDYSGKWFITFGHFTAKEGIDFGSKVKAGEFIGTSTIHAQIPDDGVEAGLSQDNSTETIKERFVRGSLLDYATDEVLADYASYGLTPENVAFTKEYRDAHPCSFIATSKDPNNFAILNKKG